MKILWLAVSLILLFVIQVINVYFNQAHGILSIRLKCSVLALAWGHANAYPLELLLPLKAK